MVEGLSKEYPTSENKTPVGTIWQVFSLCLDRASDFDVMAAKCGNVNDNQARLS